MNGQFRKCLPRTGGGGSNLPSHRAVKIPSSPHGRGWLHSRVRPRHRRSVFLARAGVARSCPRQRRELHCLPRTGGGDSWNTPPYLQASSSSPHGRGWLQVPGSIAVRGVVFPAWPGWLVVAGAGPPVSPVFPAWAGVAHSVWGLVTQLPSLPRTGGGDSFTSAPVPTCPSSRTGGGGSAPPISSRFMRRSSPHRRGWVSAQLRRRQRAHVFPAQARVARGACRGSSRTGRLPRTGGGGSCLWVRAPWPRWSCPHGRGGSSYRTASPVPCQTSLHGRGWLPPGRRALDREPVFPARAGVTRPSSRRLGRSRGLPRTGGGVGDDYKIIWRTD